MMTPQVFSGFCSVCGATLTERIEGHCRIEASFGGSPILVEWRTTLTVRHCGVDHVFERSFMRKDRGGVFRGGLVEDAVYGTTPAADLVTTGIDR